MSTCQHDFCTAPTVALLSPHGHLMVLYQKHRSPGLLGRVFIRSCTDAVMQCSGDGVHIMTGPIYICGAQPGDVLQVGSSPKECFT
jgi:hypothetical protein